MTRKRIAIVVAGLLAAAGGYLGIDHYTGHIERSRLLEEACARGDTARMVDLIRVGCDPNGGSDSYRLDRHGFVHFRLRRLSPKPPLHLAVSGGHSEAVRLLLEAGANPNAYHEDSNAIGIAIVRDQRDIVQLLLDAGASTDLPFSNEGALDLARKFKREEIIRLIERSQSTRSEAQI